MPKMFAAKVISNYKAVNCTVREVLVQFFFLPSKHSFQNTANIQFHVT